MTPRRQKHSELERRRRDRELKSLMKSRRTLELVQNLAVRIVVATQAAGINGDSLRAWLTMVKE